MGYYPPQSTRQIDPELSRNMTEIYRLVYELQATINTLTSRLQNVDRRPIVAPKETAQSEILSGFGSPEGVIVAEPGRIYVNRSGGATLTLYIKESGQGSTGWVAK